MRSIKTKDPDDVQAYRWRYFKRLAPDETITASTFTVQSGITKDSDTHDDTTATIVLSGGTAGETYLVTNHVTTSEGQEWDWSTHVQVVDL